jgi:hypothetical protein
MTQPPAQVILDLSDEVTRYINTLAQLHTELVDDYAIGRAVSDLFSYMHDKVHALSYVNSYVSDCVEVFANDYEPSVDLSTQEPGFMSRELNSGESRAYIYGSALKTLGEAIYQRLESLKMYNEDDILCYGFRDFVGRDALLEYISPRP